MAAQTGRTVSKFVDVQIHDGTALRSIPVDSINGVGLTYEEKDLTAFQDAIKNVLLNQPSCTITLAGPFDTTAVQTAGTLSGSHTVLAALNGVLTPRSLNVLVGIRHAWVSGEPVFGITSSATSGFIVSEYTPDINNGKYSAKLVVMGGVAPAWGTTANT